MLTSVLNFLSATIVMAFGYRWLRNGCLDPYLPKWLVGNTLSRTLWIFTYLLGFTAIVHDARLWVLVWLFAAQQAAIRVPHGYIMDVGCTPRPERRWPSFFMPQLSQWQWDNMTDSERATWDSVQAACVGLVRGVIAFFPLVFFGYSPVSLLAPVFVILAGTPLAYFIGNFIPFDFMGTDRNSVEWGEVLHGIVWAIAFATIG